MREDEPATAVVEHFEAAFVDREIPLEESYDHYGNRGPSACMLAFDRLRGSTISWNSKPIPPSESRPGPTRASGSPGAWSGTFTRATRTRCAESSHARAPAHSPFSSSRRRSPASNTSPNTAACTNPSRRRQASSVPAVRKVAFLTNLDRAAEGDLGFLSVNADLPFDSGLFREALPSGSRLETTVPEADLER